MNWQPIETAPKDGSRILLYIPAFIGDKVWTGLWCDGWGAAYQVLKGKEEPTHWMPLPDPPEGA